jgi:hypothetical protein
VVNFRWATLATCCIEIAVQPVTFSTSTRVQPAARVSMATTAAILDLPLVFGAALTASFFGLLAFLPFGAAAVAAWRTRAALDFFGTLTVDYIKALAVPAADVLVLDEAAFLDLPDARRERLIADQVVTMEKQFTKATRPAVTVRL